MRFKADLPYPFFFMLDMASFIFIRRFYGTLSERLCPAATQGGNKLYTALQLFGIGIQ